MKPGTPLPSIRALAADLSCSVITTSRAYQNLEQKRFIRTVQGKGTFVADIQAEEKEKIAQSSVYQAFREAIEMSLRMHQNAEQTRQTFETVLADVLRERGMEP